MATFTNTTRQAIVDRYNLNTRPVAEEWSARRMLSALGHPGYGERFARQVLDILATRPGVSAHQAVYGSL